MTVTFERAKEKIATLGLCLLVGTVSGGILLLNLSVKWEVVVLGVLGIIVLILATNKIKLVLLCFLAFIVSIPLGKAIVDRPGYAFWAGGVEIMVSDICTLTLLLILLGKSARRQVKINSFSLIMVPAITWLIASSLSLLAAKDGELSSFQLINMVKMLLLCWVVANSIGSDVDLTLVITGLMLGMVFQSLVGIYQGVTGRPFLLSFIDSTAVVGQQQLSVGLVNRIRGTMGSSTTLAMYLAIGVPFTLALLFSKTKPFVKISAGITLCLIGSALIMSLSRAGWVNFLVTICLILVLAVRRKRISSIMAIVIACVMALVLLGVALFGTDLILSRLTSNDQGAANSRITLAKGALAIIQDNPVIGVGLDNYAQVSPRFDPIDVASWNHYTPIVHNIYLLIAAETGLIGLAAFLVFFVILLIQAWRIIDRAPNDTVWVAGVGILGALVALAIHSMVDYTLLGSSLVFTLFWLLAGLTAALIQRVNYEKLNS
jgi:putative inorganic carbon (HCO3(-)) transporter